MKTFTSLLVNRLFSSVFTLTFLFFAFKANALTTYSTPNNPGIEYASLVANATEKGVFINWVTVSEQNNSHFEVERSTDSKSFKTVAMVLDGFATTGKDGKTYKFKEAAGDIRKGKTVYYRLKQIDNNNQVHYSIVMAVQMNATVTVFPKKETSISKVYTDNQSLLSKQSLLSVGEIKIPAPGSNAGILVAHKRIAGTVFNSHKSNRA
ncbi:MAG: hypothetical protein IPL54_03710 [Chitinophagaceae bacterium]|nr:hypothetical protein [Chitinophagaceae bacterium]